MTRLLTILILVFSTNASFAYYRMVASDLSTEYLGGDSILIRFEMKRGCNGFGGWTTYPVKLKCGSTVLDTVDLELSEPSVLHESICSDTQSSAMYCGCVINTWMIFGFFQSTFEKVVHLDEYSGYSNCAQLEVVGYFGRFRWTSNVAQTLSGYYTNGQYYSYTVNDPFHITRCIVEYPDSTENSTPTGYGFDSPIFIHSYDDANISMAMIDLDGDSLVYSLSPTLTMYPIGGPIDTVDYVSPYTYQNPVSLLEVDSFNGQITFKPEFFDTTYFYGYYEGPADGYVFSIQTDEYDRQTGNWKGQSQRNFWLAITENESNYNPETTGIDSVSGSASQVNNQLIVTQGDPFTLYITFEDQDSLQSIEVRSNLEGIADNYSVQQVGSNPTVVAISGTLNFVVEDGFDFIIQARDDFCVMRGFASHSFRMSSIGVSVSNKQICLGNSVGIEVVGDSATWTSISGDTLNGSNFNCNSGCTSAEFQLSDTTEIVVSVLQSSVWHNDTFSINVLPIPSEDISFVGAPCLAEEFSVVITDSSSSSFEVEWEDYYNFIPNHFDDTIAFTGLNADTFTMPYSLLNAHGCNVTDTFILNVHPIPNVTAGVYPQTCIGQPFQLQPSGAVSYKWSPSTYLSDTVDMPIATLQGSIIYTVIGTDSFGCRAQYGIHFDPSPNWLQASIVDSNSNPVKFGKAEVLAHDTSSSTYTLIEVVELTGYNYFSIPISEAFHTIYFEPDTNYYPELLPTFYSKESWFQNSNAFQTEYCDTTSVNFEVLHKEIVGVMNAESSLVKLYPNPTNDLLFFTKSIEDVSVYSIEGSVVLSESGNIRSLSLTHLNSGVYLVGYRWHGIEYWSRISKE